MYTINLKGKDLSECLGISEERLEEMEQQLDEAVGHLESSLSPLQIGEIKAVTLFEVCQNIPQNVNEVLLMGCILSQYI